jgi:hypothetical protein
MVRRFIQAATFHPFVTLAVLFFWLPFENCPLS